MQWPPAKMPAIEFVDHVVLPDDDRVNLLADAGVRIAELLQGVEVGQRFVRIQLDLLGQKAGGMSALVNREKFVRELENDESHRRVENGPDSVGVPASIRFLQSHEFVARGREVFIPVLVPRLIKRLGRRTGSCKNRVPSCP